MSDAPRDKPPSGQDEATGRNAQMKPAEVARPIAEQDSPLPLIEDPDTGDHFLIYVGKQGATTELRFEGDQPWFTQAQMAKIFGVDVRTANEHVARFLSDGDLDPATIRKFRIVRQEGTRRVEREIEHYGLDVAFYVGYRVNSQQGTVFRRWATDILVRYATRGFVIDAGRLKTGGEFDRIAELREVIRDIRAAEANVYAELRRICSMCQDYDPSSESARDFYTHMQAKLYWATVSKTPAMVRKERADAGTANMGVQTFSGNDVLKADTAVAKNFLFGPELKELNRLTTILLDVFEDQLDIGKLTLMSEAESLLDAQLRGLSRVVLRGGGNVSKSDADRHVDAEYKKFDARRRQLRAEQIASELAALKATEQDIPKVGRGRPAKTAKSKP